MILLLGGTSETSPIAMRLAQSGYRVLVSKATEIPLRLTEHPNVQLRSGPLDDRGLAALLQERGIRLVVDATHPYATTIRQTAHQVAGDMGIPYLSFVRPPAVDTTAVEVEWAADHRSAAVAAVRFGRPILLTTGTNNLHAYGEQAQRAGVPLIVRTLDRPESLSACQKVGIPRDRLIVAQGPFSVEDNRRHLRTFRIGVLVTKDSGHTGGTLEKLQAAQTEGCRVILIARPATAAPKPYTDVDSLLMAVAAVGPLDVRPTQ